ncbi:hypothetical protein IV41_GL001200 [Limosilactobacillus ingluviei]|uniref:Uncharacterized protein n=1 Tax=Limosilactobacillus ingluviei TaxID=148604 RepID=A0A0R2GWU1_9LACO|nr:hypothetical protein IV41_GL001200 [Limosilactobacillus ingluviei]
MVCQTLILIFCPGRKELTPGKNAKRNGKPTGRLDPAPAPSGLVAGQCDIRLTTALIKGGKRVDNGQLVVL